MHTSKRGHKKAHNNRQKAQKAPKAVLPLRGQIVASVVATNVIRITTQHESSTTRLFLEGKLSGACVDELAKCWQNNSSRKDELLVDLTSVSYVDEHGKELLTRMHSHGTKLFSRSLMTKCLIAEIKNHS